VDQEHAEEMRAAIAQLSHERMRDNSDYVCRVTSDEGDRGKGFLSRFQELETATPAVLTTSQLLTTGVDAPTCKNVVLARVIGSMTDFKQIIGRGTRVREDYGKLYFNILDYTGSATRLFADPDFDGEPARISEEQMDENGRPVPGTETIEPGPDEAAPGGIDDVIIDWVEERRKYYFDGGQFEIAAHVVYELDADGKQLKVVKFTDYAGEKVRTLYQSAESLRQKWASATQRSEIVTALEDRGIDIDRVGLRPNSRMRMLSTCSVTWLSMHRFAHGVNALSGYEKIAKISLIATPPMRAPSWTSSWRNTPSTVPVSS